MNKIRKILSYSLLNIIVSGNAKSALEVAKGEPVGLYMMYQNQANGSKDFGLYNPKFDEAENGVIGNITNAGDKYIEAAVLPQSVLASIILGKGRDDIVALLKKMQTGNGAITTATETAPTDKNKAFVKLIVANTGTTESPVYKIDSFQEVFYIDAKGNKKVFKPDNTFFVPADAYQESDYPASATEVSNVPLPNTTSTLLNSPAYLETLFQAAKRHKLSDDEKLTTTRGFVMLDPSASSFAGMNALYKAPKDAVATTAADWPVMLLPPLDITNGEKADLWFMMKGKGVASEQQNMAYTLQHRRGDVITPILNDKTSITEYNTWMNLGSLEIDGRLGANLVSIGAHEFTGVTFNPGANPILETSTGHRVLKLGEEEVYVPKADNKVAAKGVPFVNWNASTGSQMFEQATLGMKLLNTSGTTEVINDEVFGAGNRNATSWLGDDFGTNPSAGDIRISNQQKGVFPLEIVMAVVEKKPQYVIDALLHEWVHGLGWKRALPTGDGVTMNGTLIAYNPITGQDITTDGMMSNLNDNNVKWLGNADERLYADLNDLQLKLTAGQPVANITTLNDTVIHIHEEDNIDLTNKITLGSDREIKVGNDIVTLFKGHELTLQSNEAALWDYVAHKRGSVDLPKRYLGKVIKAITAINTASNTAPSTPATDATGPYLRMKYETNLPTPGMKFTDVEFVGHNGTAPVAVTLTKENIFLVPRNDALGNSLIDAAQATAVKVKDIHPADGTKYGQYAGFVVDLGENDLVSYYGASNPTPAQYFPGCELGAFATEAQGVSRPNLWVDYLARVKAAGGTVPSLSELGGYVSIDVQGVGSNAAVAHLKSGGQTTSSADWRIELKYKATPPTSSATEYIGQLRPGCPGVYKKDGKLYCMIGDTDIDLKALPENSGYLYSVLIGPDSITNTNPPVKWGVNVTGGTSSQSTINNKQDMLANWLQDYVEYYNKKSSTLTPATLL